MQRDLLLITEMIDSAAQAIALVGSDDVATITTDRQRHEALLWNFTVLGEASSQLSDELLEAHPRCPVASARPTSQPNRARLLVDRHQDPL